MQEIVSNLLKHSAATVTRIEIDVSDDQLNARIWNDGVFVPSIGTTAGKGLTNIKVRITELDGEVDWSFDDSNMSYAIAFSIPLSDG